MVSEKTILCVLSGDEGPEQVSCARRLMTGTVESRPAVQFERYTPRVFPHLTGLPGQSFDVPKFFRTGLRYRLYLMCVFPWFLALQISRRNAGTLVVFDSALALAIFPAAFVMRVPIVLFLAAVPWTWKRSKNSKLSAALEYFIDCFGILAAEKIIVPTEHVRTGILREASFIKRYLHVLPSPVVIVKEYAVRPEKETVRGAASRLYERREPVSPERAALLEKYNLPERAFIIVTQSDLLPQASVVNLLYAIAGIEDGRCHLFIVGGGSARDTVLSIAVGLGLTDRLVVLESQIVPHELLAGCDLFVAVDRYPVMSDALMHALGCGIPVVGFKSGELEEILEAEELLCPPTSVEELTQKLVQWQRPREGLKPVRAHCETIAKKYAFPWPERALQVIRGHE